MADPNAYAAPWCIVLTDGTDDPNTAAAPWRVVLADGTIVKIRQHPIDASLFRVPRMPPFAWEQHQMPRLAIAAIIREFGWAISEILEPGVLMRSEAIAEAVAEARADERRKIVRLLDERAGELGERQAKPHHCLGSACNRCLEWSSAACVLKDVADDLREPAATRKEATYG